MLITQLKAYFAFSAFRVAIVEERHCCVPGARYEKVLTFVTPENEATNVKLLFDSLGDLLEFLHFVAVLAVGGVDSTSLVTYKDFAFALVKTHAGYIGGYFTVDLSKDTC